MSRINGSFNYTLVQEARTDPETGFIVADAASEYLAGCECQIDKSIPARQLIGTDGQVFQYTYDVFIPKYFNGELAIGAKVRLLMEDGGTDEFTIQGIDDCNRKYIEIWG